jgi:hypothetical protein
MAFKVGDRVEWTSQAAGVTRTKVGVVEHVVAPREDPGPMSKNRVPGMPRDHESYLVRVKGRGCYWPRVKALRLVTEPTP